MRPPLSRQALEKYPPLCGRKGLQAPHFIVIMCGILPESWNLMQDPNEYEKSDHRT